MPHRKCQAFTLFLAGVRENLIQILFCDVLTDFEWASRQPGKPVAQSVAHISGERLQNGDEDADRGIDNKIDPQRRETLRALPKVRYRHSRRHLCFLAFVCVCPVIVVNLAFRNPDEFARLVRFAARAHDWRCTTPFWSLFFCSRGGFVEMNEPCAVILAAGKGTRMKSDLPKVLCPVVGRPMIHFVLDALEKAGIRRHIVVVGHEAEMVEAELKSRQADTQFVLQSPQLGTGHAVQMCRDVLAEQQGPTIVVAGDSPLIQASSLQDLLQHFEQTQPALLLGTLEKDDPTGLGRIVRDQEGEFTGIVEHKDATAEQLAIREVNMSTYLFQTQDLLQVLEQLSDDNAQSEYYLTDCARLLREAGRPVAAVPVLKECESLSINNVDELQQVDEQMRAMGYA